MLQYRLQGKLPGQEQSEHVPNVQTDAVEAPGDTNKDKEDFTTTLGEDKDVCLNPSGEVLLFFRSQSYTFSWQHRGDVIYN